MSLQYKIKIKIYRFLSEGIGKLLLQLLSNFVYVKNLKLSKQKNKEFLVAITIDTESGYIDKEESRVWQRIKPESYIGFYKGIENWRKLLSKHNAKATFFLSTNCFSAKNIEYKKIMNQLELLLKEKHEIGLHTHPDSDLALQQLLKKKFNATSARFYNKKELKEIVSGCKNLIKKHLGIDVTSFRWGNWALNTDAVKVLNETGFKIDSSATPGIKGHTNDGMYYDWSKTAKHYPWHLSLDDYQNTTKQDSKVLEIPIATFNFFGITLRADPVYTELLKAAFDYYCKNADRSKKPFVFVVISHSIEGAYLDGSSTKLIKHMEEFLQYAKKFNNVRFITLREAYKLLK